MKNIVPLFPLLLMFTQPGLAIREGTANANIFIKSYEQRGDFGKLALWHEAAAECVTRISVPMNEIAHCYYTQHGYEKWAARAQKEAQEIQAQRLFHLKRAKAAWKKSDTAETVLNAERQKIAKFIETWVPHYPDRFYEFGIYPTFFRKQRRLAEQEGDYAKVLQLEADAAEMCAAQYQKIPIAYGLKNYEKRREAYLRHAAHLRGLAQQNPKAVPPEADRGKQIRRTHFSEDMRDPSKKADTILHIAKNALVAELSKPDKKRSWQSFNLNTLKRIHEYPRFQGFAWTVRFSNHSWGNLAIAIIDDKTGKVLDVLN